MLREQLDTALKEGLKGKDSCTVATVRLILAAIKERDIAARGKGGEDPVDDDIIRELLQTMIKQRRESIDLYQNCLLYTSPSPRDGLLSRMPSSA